MKPFYLTTTLPYVNADPHIGFALELCQADAIVRYQRLLGADVFFNTGTDEHGLKIFRKAEERGIETQAYCDEYAAKFRDLARLLTLDNPTFIRTTDEHHVKAAQAFWKRCDANGDIYKKNYQVKYCVGCELEKTDSELEEGKCPIHPSYELEIIDEENYFFRFSNYQEKLLSLYDANPDFVVPAHRLSEIRSFVDRGLEDFSISRLKEKMPWGVSVPGDEKHVMYVWFDALINYISTLGWPSYAEASEGKPSDFERFWEADGQPNALQVAGKDNLRQQSAMWQAMLLSAGITSSRQIFIHGFITSEGQKMSKSLGNVINPYDIVEKYGVDAVRYFLLGGLPPTEDGDFALERFEEYYTAHLANGIGNLTSRILTMVEKYSEGKLPAIAPELADTERFWEVYDSTMQQYHFDELVKHVQNLVAFCDETISSQKPWEKAANGENIAPLLYQLAETLRHIAVALLPIIPDSAEKILTQLSASDIRGRGWGNLSEGAILKKSDPLFPRLG